MSEFISANQQSAIRNLPLAIVLNPRALAGSNAALWQRACDALRGRGPICSELETCGDGENVARIARFIAATRPETVVAAGGDGTVSETTQAIMRMENGVRPALAIVPLGTANDIARSLGLLSLRQRGATAVELAVSTLLEGVERRIDLGEASANGAKRYFAGSFTVGMDAAILATRNRLRQCLRLGRRLSGYPLYLWSCAVNVTMHHGSLMRLRVDAVERTSLVYNLLVANTPQYAGEFRFDGDNTSDDGYLDLHLFTGAFDYLRRYPAAWRRHVHYSRGERVAPPRELQRIRELIIESAAPVAAQLDGEEWETAASYQIRVVPQALRVRVPPQRVVTSS